MAKPLMVTLGNEAFSFSLSEVERADLYGSRKRVPTDSSGRTCTRAALTQDGSLLIASGMSGQGYFNAAGQYVSRGQLVGVDAQGAVVRPLQRAEALAIAEKIKAHSIKSVAVAFIN
jgi:hypothetical protein